MSDKATVSFSGGLPSTSINHNTVDEITYPALLCVPTANRPTGVKQGTQIYDTTLNKPVWAKTGGASPVWVDATGGTV